MQQPQACIFDLDGVIVHTARFHYKAWKALADSLSIPFGEEQNELLKGVSREKSLQMILEMGDKKLDQKTFKQLMDQKNQEYLSYISQLDKNDVAKNILPFMKALTLGGIKLAIGSSSKNAQKIIDQLQIRDMFEVIVDGTQVKRTKPDPEIFLKAAQRIDAPPEACVVFEDATSGIAAARQAGMRAVGVGDNTTLGKADFVIQSFAGLKPQELWTKLMTK